MSGISEVILDNRLENDLVAACRVRLPYESCGVIYGVKTDSRLVADGFALIRNVSASPADSFAFDPGEWVTVFYAAQKNQRTIVGLFHSHPDGSVVPSLPDKQGWIPWETYWIVGPDRADRSGKTAIYACDSGTGSWRRLPVVRHP